MLYGVVAPEGRVSVSPTQTEGLYQALLSWRSTSFQEIAHSALAQPHTLLLMCRYHHIILALFRPFVTATNLPLDVRYYRDRALQISRASTQNLRQLVESHMLMEDRNILSYHYCPMVACSILDEFRTLQQRAIQAKNDEDDPMGADYQHLADLTMNSPSYRVFVTCLRHMLNVGGSLYMSQIALRAVQSAAEQAQVALPMECWEVFGQLNDPSWTAQALKYVVSSFAPGKTAQDADGARVDELLQTWDKLSVTAPP